MQDLKKALDQLLGGLITTFWILLTLFATGFPVAMCYHFPKFFIAPLLVIILSFVSSWKHYTDANDRILSWAMICIGLFLCEVGLMILFSINFDVKNKLLAWGIASGTVFLSGVGMVLCYKNLPLFSKGLLWKH